MCLKAINVSKAINLRQVGRGIDVTVYGYKCLVPTTNKNVFKSAYHEHKWVIGELSESTRKTVQVSGPEMESGKIDRGFHFYTNEQTAFDNCIDNRVVVKCAVNVKDIVAYGRNSFQGASGMVATKATPVEALRYEY